MADASAPPGSGNIGAELGRAPDIQHSTASIPVSGASLARWRPKGQPESRSRRRFSFSRWSQRATLRKIGIPA